MLSKSKTRIVKEIEFYEHEFKDKLPFWLNGDHTIGHSNNKADYDRCLKKFNYEPCTNKRDVLTTAQTELVLFESTNHKTAHRSEQLEIFKDVTLSQIHIAENKPSLIVIDDEYFMLSPILEWEEMEPDEDGMSYRERQELRHKNHAPGLLTRYHCAECHGRLSPRDKVLHKKLPGGGIFSQDVYLPCQKHPKAGIYLIFIDDQY